MVFLSISAFAQQEPYYTHFKYNAQAYNPARAGEAKNEICIVGVTHYQWRQFDDLTLERGTDPGGIPNVLEYGKNVAPETHNINLAYMFELGVSGRNFMGIGAAITDDNVGVTKTTTVHIDLNYKRKFNDGMNEIAFGVGLGNQQFGVHNPNFKWRDPGDPLIPTASVTANEFNMNVGIYYRQDLLGPLENFYAGISMTQVNMPVYQLNAYTREFVPHVYTLIGADYDMDIVVLEPAILIKNATGARSVGFRPQVDLHATALYAGTFRGGLAYRQWATTDAVSVLLGYVKSELEIGYSYDITASRVRTVSNGTHEVMVKYCFPIEVTPPVKIQRLTPRYL